MVKEHIYNTHSLEFVKNCLWFSALKFKNIPHVLRNLTILYSELSMVRCWGKRRQSNRSSDNS